MGPKCAHAKNEIVMFNYQQQLFSNIFNLGHTTKKQAKTCSICHYFQPITKYDNFQPLFKF